MHGVIAGLGTGEGIGRVEGRVIAIDHELAVKFVGAGLGKDFNAAVTQLVVFGRKRILVDANLANRGLGGKLAGGETVDVHLAAIRSRRGPGQGLQVGQQFVGIVGQSFELLAGDGDGSCVALGIDVDRGRGVGNLYLLRLHFDGERNVQAQGLGRDFYFGVFVQRESWSHDIERVLARREAFEFIHALSVGFGRERRASRRGEGDIGLSDNGAGLIRDLAAQTC